MSRRNQFRSYAAADQRLQRTLIRAGAGAILLAAALVLLTPQRSTPAQPLRVRKTPAPWAAPPSPAVTGIELALEPLERRKHPSPADAARADVLRLRLRLERERADLRERIALRKDLPDFDAAPLEQRLDELDSELRSLDLRTE
ncbi:MAG: hypothetical protein NW241_19600 [Bacteroidia bacterium]|nr:hypothetical protein [Bacteroidia bacterium]